MFEAVIFIAVLAVALWLGWQNWSSKYVQRAISNGFTIGLIASLVTPADSVWLRLAITAGSVLAAILIALKDEDRNLEFTAAFVADTKTKQPLEAKNEIYAHYFVGRTGPDDPVRIVARIQDEFTHDASGEQLYFDVILRMLLDRLFSLYQMGWDLKLTRDDVLLRRVRWSASDTPGNTDRIGWKSFRELFPDSPALKLNLIETEKLEMLVPGGTQLDAKTDIIHNQPWRRTLSLKNQYVVATIGLAMSGGHAGMGRLAKVLGYDEERSNDYFVWLFDVQLSARFNRFRSGHPQMEKYQRWIGLMFAEIQDLFDLKMHWDRGKEWVMISKLSSIK